MGVTVTGRCNQWTALSGWTGRAKVPWQIHPLEPVVQGDLKADEGAFCLWHAHEPLDLLPNDEGNNFRNTDLQCHLQTSSQENRECEFNPENRRRGLVRKRGNRLNGLNYPVQGSTI